MEAFIFRRDMKYFVCGLQQDVNPGLLLRPDKMKNIVKSTKRIA